MAAVSVVLFCRPDPSSRTGTLQALYTSLLDQLQRILRRPSIDCGLRIVLLHWHIAEVAPLAGRRFAWYLCYLSRSITSSRSSSSMGARKP